jgi:hypothetical protein
MQYATEIGDANLGGVDAFCKLLGVELPAAEDKLVIRQSELGEAMRVVVLKPESEAARR